MLVLSRRVNERILIGDNIRIVVISMRGDKVRIGIDAPDDVLIMRPEVLDRINGIEGPHKRRRNDGRD